MLKMTYCRLAVLALLFSCLALAAAQTGSRAAQGSPQAISSANLQLSPVKELRKGVDAWPLIVNPATPAEQRVNATLTRLNLRLAQALRECDAAARDEAKLMGTAGKDQDSTLGSWSRSIRVTMTGPRFLSLVATDNIYCGGAHPNSDVMAMVFDMTTGTPVNWPAQFPKSAEASSFVDSVEDGSKVGALVLPALLKIYAAAATSECKDAFQNTQSFLLWPDAQHGTLVAQAFDLPHAAQDCADELDVTIEQARKLGFDESVLIAIEQAHRQMVANPKR
jgi:hypothetical protein